MAWPTRKQAGLDASEKKTYGKGVFRKCDGCNETMTAEALGQNFEVCPQCGHHHKLSSSGWRELLLDDGELDEWDAQGLPPPRSLAQDVRGGPGLATQSLAMRHVEGKCATWR